MFPTSPLGPTEGIEMVKSILVDDGVKGRVHSRQVLEGFYTQIGAACGCHALYGDVCCVMYGQAVLDKEKEVPWDVLRVDDKD